MSAKPADPMTVSRRLFIGALCLLSVGGSIVDPAFNNYVRDTFKLAADARGTLEFPRELPGFLVMVTSGLLFWRPTTGCRTRGFRGHAGMPVWLRG